MAVVVTSDEIFEGVPARASLRLFGIQGRSDTASSRSRTSGFRLSRPGS